MAIASGTVWEVRSTATAGNVNGGGFNPGNTGNAGGPGTDRSQSDTSFANGTDLIAATATTTPVITTTSSHTFTAADCGNLIHINSGTNWTAGVYEIVSVSAGAATLDRACGSSAALTSGTYHLGGAFSMNDASDVTTFQFTVPGNSWWIKAGTYTAGSNWNVSGTGTYLLPINFQGYQTTRGDNPTGSNRPLLKLGSSFFFLITGGFVNIANISVIGTSTNDSFGVFGITGNFNRIMNCKAVNQSTGDHAAMIVGSDTTIYACELVAYGSSGLKISSNGLIDITNCYFHDSVNGLLQAFTGSPISVNIQNSIFENCTTAGINISGTTSTGPYLVQNNTFYGGETSKVGSGIFMQETSSVALLTAMNNIFYGLSTGINIVNVSGINVNMENYNTFFNCTTARTNIGVGSNSVTINPGFASVGQYTGTTATSSGTTLTDSGAAFTNVVAGRDYLYVSASTGGNTGIFGITAKTATTLTTDNSLGTGTAITYSVIYGHNFAVGSAMRVASTNTGNPNTLTYPLLGAAQSVSTLAATFVE